MSRYVTITQALENCADKARDNHLTLGEAFESLQESSYSFICILLAAPFLQPISLGPLSSIGGLTFAALGWQLARGHATPWLPEKTRGIALSPKTWQLLIKICLKILKFCKRFTKNRRASLVTGRRGQKITGVLIAVSGLLMAIPFFGVPFNNTFPAIAVVLICIGELEGDGLMVFWSIGVLILTVLYFLGIIIAFLFFGTKILEWIKTIPWR